MSYKDMASSEIIDVLCEMDSRKSQIAKEILQAQAELQTRGLKVLEDKNIKSTEFYGIEGRRATVTLAQKMEILNYGRLENLLGKSLAREKIVRSEEIKYDVNDAFKKALIALFSGDYEAGMTLEYMLKREFPSLSATQISLLVRKLKGDYAKDKATLQALVGSIDVDEELYFIYKIKNFEMVKAFFGEEELDNTARELKKCVMVDETPKISVKYDKGARDGAEEDR